MSKEISAVFDEIRELKKRASSLRRAQTMEPVKDYEFQNESGSVKLSDLFQGKSDLVLVHNMGKGCPYCTVWADGYNGLVPELESRAGFAVVTADPVDKFMPFAKERGWRFNIASASDPEFRRDMEFAGKDDAPWPGALGFWKDEQGNLFRTVRAPGDDCEDMDTPFAFFDLLKDGVNGWEPNYRL